MTGVEGIARGRSSVALAMVWGKSERDVAAVMVADGGGRATVWVNDRLHGAEPWLVAQWARSRALAGRRFAAVRLDELRAAVCGAASA